MRPRGALAVAATAGLFELLAAPAPLAANGRYPSAGQIAIDPSDPAHMMVRATYGLLASGDGGASWSWTCEAAVGFQGLEDPMLAITADGTVLAALQHGLGATRDRGCTWQLDGDSFGGAAVVDLAVERREPSHVLALVSRIRADDTVATEVWMSSDDGRRWQRSAGDLPPGFIGLTLDGAPSDPRRIYVSGRDVDPSSPALLLRSDDGGASWRALPLPGDGLPYIGALDPMDPDRIYVRRDGATSDTLLATTDGGATWREVFSATSLLGLAVSPDGTQLAAGGPDDGLFVASTADLDLRPIATIAVRCLTWTDEGLLACGDAYTDGFTVGRSIDGGRSFTPLLAPAGLCQAPIGCAEAGPAAATCAPMWPPVALSLGLAESCAAPEPDASPSSGGCASGGGASGTAFLLLLLARSLGVHR